MKTVKNIVPVKTICEIADKYPAWVSARMTRSNNRGSVFHFSEKDCELLNSCLHVVSAELKKLTLPIDQRRDPMAFYESMKAVCKFIKSSYLAKELGMARGVWADHLAVGEDRYWFTYQEVAILQGAIDNAIAELESIVLDYEPL